MTSGLTLHSGINLILNNCIRENLKLVAIRYQNYYENMHKFSTIYRCRFCDLDVVRQL